MNNCVLGRLFIFEINVGLLQKIIKNLYIFDYIYKLADIVEKPSRNKNICKRIRLKKYLLTAGN